MFLAIALCALLAHAAFAQTAPAPSGLYRIAGTVVSSTDGHPLAGASINIRQQDNPGAPINQTATSSDDGRFEFTGLPAGNFTLQGVARNFLPTFYDDHDGFTTGIITGSTVSSDSLTLKLIPKASLSGSITNDAGEPVANAQVRLFRQSRSFGDGRIVPAATQSTDDLGQFEFLSLNPADYLVAVIAQPWYAVHPQPDLSARITMPQFPANATAEQQAQMRANFTNAQTQLRRQALFGVTGPLDPALDVAYPITYYPHGDDPTEAEPIPLRPGDSRHISLELSAVPAVTITISHDAPEPQPPLDPLSPNYQAAINQFAQAQQRRIPQLRTSIFGNVEPAQAQQMQSTPTSTTFNGLPPGDYLLSTAGTPVNQASAATPIHLSGSSGSATATLPDASALAHVHISLQVPPGTTPAGIAIGLVHSGDNVLFSRPVAPKGEAILDAPPGDYSFVLNPSTGSGRPDARFWFIRGITADGKPFPANSIHLAAGDSPAIVLSLVPGNHTLRGFVVHAASDAGAPPTPAAGVFLLLVPSEDLNTAHARFWRQQSDLDGSFSISGLAAGSYQLFAIDDGWTLDWRQPHALDHYLPAAAQITVPDNAEATVRLPRPIQAQSK